MPIIRSKPSTGVAHERGAVALEPHVGSQPQKELEMNARLLKAPGSLLLSLRYAKASSP